MPDYSGLLQALAGEQQSYAQQNPWIIGGQAVLKTPVYATNETDPLQTALVQALQGLVGGFATSYGQGQVKTQADELSSKLQSALMGAQQPGGAGLADALLADSDPAVKKLGQVAYMQQLAQEAEDQSRVRKLIEEESIKSQYREPSRFTVYDDGRKFTAESDRSSPKGYRVLGSGVPAYQPNKEVSDRYKITDPDVIKANERHLESLLPDSTPEERRAIASDRDLFRQYGVQTRSDRNLDFRKEPPDKVIEAVGNYAGGRGILDNLKKLTSEANDSVLERNLAQLWPSTDSAFLQNQLELYAGIAREMRESGVMTEPDYQRWKKNLSFQKLDTPASVARRLAAFGQDADMIIDGKLKAYKTKYDTSGLEDIVYGGKKGELGKLPPPFNPASEKLLQNPKTGEFKVVPR